MSSAKFVCRFLGPSSPSLMLKISPFLLAQGGHLSHGSFLTYFREEGRAGGGGRQSGLPASAASLTPPAGEVPYAKVPSFG